MKILVATSPFGKTGQKPLNLLEETGWEIIKNPYSRRLTAKDVKELIQGVDAVIAGTEPYRRDVLEKNKSLKLISRVGIGLDSVDLKACKDLGIAVTYTPEAPSQAVAELTIGNIINLLRYTLNSDKSVREGAWNRYIGVLLEEIIIGVIGVGRIGKRVCKLLKPFNPKILACDLEPDYKFGDEFGLEWVDKNEIFSRSDLVTLHIPYTQDNHYFVNRETISEMKTGSFLVNTSRGPIIDESALVDALLQNHLEGAALDVFEKEPYEGRLTTLDNVVLTAHMGASARKSRYLMELGAAENAIRVLNGEPPIWDAIKDNVQ